DTLSIGDGATVVLRHANLVVLNHLEMSGIDFGPMTLTPEPATMGVLGAGLVLLLQGRRRRGVTR
ncbi:MAG: PEP-CTERM sorting domain-containing protein, partial [Planctomycetes bacterium]|nr:PEP-CTERM sorting domain-containing protein [Planctomycetota bacterium]